MRLHARAKLTVSLRVTGLRADGFHLIDAEMISLDLADVIDINVAPESSMSVDGPYAEGVPVDESNLVMRALSFAGRTARVAVTKNIPHGGGLGGGSADAAAVLRWAGVEDADAASTLGADIPFCLVGGRARVRGVGEIIEPMPHVDRDITLFIPPVHVSTPLVYRTWDDMGGPVGDMGNDLEPAAVRAVPELAMWRDLIADLIGERPHLAGSGATWFAEGHRGSDNLLGIEHPRGMTVIHTRSVTATP